MTVIRHLGNELVQDFGIRLAIRIGIHTGLVVVGAEAGGAPYGQLAVGATPNLAAKLHGLAAPETVVISRPRMTWCRGISSHPVIEWLQRGVPDNADTPVPERMVRLEALVHQARLDLYESLPLLAALVHLELPEERYPALQLTPQAGSGNAPWKPCSHSSWHTPNGSRCSS